MDTAHEKLEKLNYNKYLLISKYLYYFYPIIKAAIITTST